MNTPKEDIVCAESESETDSGTDSDDYFSDDDLIHKIHNLNSSTSFSRSYCSDTELYNMDASDFNDGDNQSSDSSYSSSSDSCSSGSSSSSSGSDSSDSDSDCENIEDDELLRVIHLPMEKLGTLD